VQLDFFLIVLFHEELQKRLSFSAIAPLRRYAIAPLRLYDFKPLM